MIPLWVETRKKEHSNGMKKYRKDKKDHEVTRSIIDQHGKNKSHSRLSLVTQFPRVIVSTANPTTDKIHVVFSWERYAIGVRFILPFTQENSGTRCSKIVPWFLLKIMFYAGANRGKFNRLK